MPPIVVVLIFVAVIGLGLYAWRKEVARRDKLRVWALRRGWKLVPGKRKDLHHAYSGIKLFDRGHSRSGDRILKGKLGDHPVTMLDYTFVTGSGKNRTTHHHGVVVLQTDFPTIPLLIRRENPFDKIGQFVGLDDIDFESAEFSRKFYVKSADRKWAYDVIHPRMMEFLLQAPSFTIEFGFTEIAVYKDGWCDPEAYEQALDLARGLYERIPDFVVRDLKGKT